MSFFGTHDPLAVSIGIRLMRALPDVEKLAAVKNSEMFRKRMMELVDGAYDMASSDPTLLKETKRIVRRELKEAVDGGDVREARIQAEEWSRLDETLYRLNLNRRKTANPGNGKRRSASSSSLTCSTRWKLQEAVWALIAAMGAARLLRPLACCSLACPTYFGTG